MGKEFFLGYCGVKERDGNVAAAAIEPENIIKLSQFTGGIAVSEKVRGGSTMYRGLILNGVRGKIGDYVVADKQNSFFIVKKEKFEAAFKLHGVLRDTI